jgi:hypothetical protein
MDLLEIVLYVVMGIALISIAAAAWDILSWR